MGAEGIGDGLGGGGIVGVENGFVTGGRKPPPTPLGTMPVLLWGAFLWNRGIAWSTGDGLLEVIGDHVGEVIPEAAPELIRLGEMVAAGGIEGGPGMDERARVSPAPAEAFDVTLGEFAGVSSMKEHGGA